MPSASLILDGVQPVESHEVVAAVAARLAASDAFIQHLGGGTASPARLHAHRVPLRDADGEEAAGAPLWCLVREMGSVAGGTEDRPSGLVTVRIQVQLNADPDADGLADPDSVLSHGHVLAWRALQGALLDERDGSAGFASTGQITRTQTPSPARLDTEGRLYSSAIYTAAVRPVA